MKQTFLIFLILQSVGLSYGQSILKNPGTIPAVDTKATMKSVILYNNPDGILNCNYILFQLGLADAYRKAGVPITYLEDLIAAIDESYIAPLNFKAGEVNISVGPNAAGNDFTYSPFRGNRTDEEGVYAITGKPVMSVQCWNFLQQLAANLQKVFTTTESDGRTTNFYLNVVAGNGNGNNNGNNTTYADTTARLSGANYHPPVPPNPQIVYLMPPSVTPPAPPPVTPVEPKCDKCPKKNWKYVAGAGAIAGVWILTEILDGNNQVGSMPGYANPSGYPFNNGSTGTGTNNGGSTGTNGPWTNTSGGSGGGYVLNGVYYPN